MRNFPHPGEPCHRKLKEYKRNFGVEENETKA